MARSADMGLSADKEVGMKDTRRMTSTMGMANL
jgi:hypothetical protein